MISLTLFGKDSNDKYRLGLEINTSIPFKGYFPSVPKGFNIFASKNRHELYLGTDIYKLLDYSRIIGIQTGYKYHFLREKKLSHFYLELSTQFSRWSHGSRQTLNYNYQNKDIYDGGSIFKIWCISSSLMIGFEKFIIKRFSLFISAGPGLMYYNEFPNPQQVQFNYASSKGFLPIINVKTGMRIYIVRREK